MTFEEFLLEAISKSAEVRLVPRRTLSYGEDDVVFYAHLLDNNGPTIDCIVKDDDLIVIENGVPRC